jgi:hypothetical protein
VTGSPASSPRFRPITGAWATGSGLLLLAAGVVGFFPDPVIGEPGRLFATAAPLNVVHAVLGVVALSIAWGLDEDARADAVLGFGILLLLLAGAEAAGNGPFGLLPGPTNVRVREATAALGALTVVMGILAAPPALAAWSGRVRGWTQRALGSPARDSPALDSPARDRDLDRPPLHREGAPAARRVATSGMGRLRPDGAGGAVGGTGGVVGGSRNYRAVREPGSRGR